MKKSYSMSSWLYFIIPSIIGAFLFMTPIKLEDGWKVPIAVLANWLDGIVIDVIEPFALFIFIVAALGSIIKLFTKEPAQRTFSDQLFRVN